MARKSDVSVAADETKCTGCLICELRCSLRFEKAFTPARSAIQVRRLAGGEDRFRVSFSDACDNCGICVRFCPYGALA
ncbi:MAG: 4Fe-4S binding protein [Chloroflexota bacterium]|nr:4Fe-4S binding protein [Chloroflexota bacterium]